MRGAWAGRALLLVFGFTLALLVGEIGLRLLHFEPKRVTYVVHEGRLRVGVPEIEFYERGETRFPNRVVHNDLGFHDRNHAADGEKYRILVIGDSFTEAKQVGVDDLFTIRLEALLRESGHAAEVINAGLAGTGAAAQYVLWSEFVAPRVAHDHVLLALYIGNELHDNSESLSLLKGRQARGAFVASDGSVYVKPYPEPQKKAFRLRDHSALVSTVQRALALLSIRLRGGEFDIDSTATSHAQAWRDSVEGTLELIRRWNREALAQGRAFSVAIVPTGEGVEGLTVHEIAFLERLRALAQAEGPPLLELDFSRFDPYDIFSFDGETLGHFNWRGHREVALQLHEWLVSQQSIPAH